MTTTPDFFGLTDKVALVVGGGLGMGESTAMHLAAAGCHVAVVDIDEARAMRVAGQVHGLGRRAIAIAADALDETTAPAAVSRVEAELGRLDVLVTIVGQAAWGRFLDIDPATFDHDISRNLRYFFFYAQAAAAAMERSGRGGAITAVASISGVRAAPSHSPYGAAKAGLVNLVKSMAIELAPSGIRVNAVAPGTIKTPRLSEGRDLEAWEQRIRDSLIPARRLGETKDIADAILYLSSGMASYVTGHTLVVDGGFTAQWLLGTGHS